MGRHGLLAPLRSIFQEASYISSLPLSPAPSYLVQHKARASASAPGNRGEQIAKRGAIYNSKSQLSSGKAGGGVRRPRSHAAKDFAV